MTSSIMFFRQMATRPQSGTKAILVVVGALSLRLPATLLTPAASAGEILYNGIELPKAWPPNRPVTFKGSHLFVNASTAAGELRVEVLDSNNTVVAPFTTENCTPVSADKTLWRVTWKGDADLGILAGKQVRFRFHLTNGQLYSFCVSPDRSGASYGFVTAGGPGFTGHRDTVGSAAYK